MRRRQSSLECALLVPDCHHPYVDPTAWSTVLAAGRFLRPQRILILGDFGDFYCLSDHRKDPRRNTFLEQEVAACNAALDDLDNLGCTYKHFLQGNHEERLERYLADRAPELFNMVTIPQLFQLRERGWTYTPYRQHLKIGKTYYTHDVGSAGARAHEAAEAAYQGNIVIGHTHRAAVTYAGTQRGKTHFGAMLGWLGDPAKAEYLHRAKRARDWMHAFGVAYIEPSGVTHLSVIPIIDGTACVNGTIVRAHVRK